jgi:hypothetical protein
MPPKKLQNWAKESSNPKRTPGAHRPRFETPRSAKETAASNGGSNPITALASRVRTSVNAAISRIRGPKIAIASIAAIAISSVAFITYRPSNTTAVPGQNATEAGQASLDTQGCSSDKYPTAKSKTEYLSDQYRIKANYVKQSYIDNNNGSSIAASNPKDFDSFLNGICLNVSAYPRTIFQNLNSDIPLFLADQIQMGGSRNHPGGFTKKTTNGLHDDISITLARKSVNVSVVSTDGSTIDYLLEGDINITWNHEFTHWLDYYFYDLESDNSTWQHAAGTSGLYTTAKTLDDTEAVPGFARSYGMDSADEDQATMAESLMSPSLIKSLVSRARTDKMLLKKIQLMTGCILDTKTGRFTRTMSEKDYKSFSGFDGYRYYLQWSDGSMDYKYWNKRLDSIPPPKTDDGFARELRFSNL